MRILLYTQYFPPETNAPANRWGYFCEYLAQKGYQIYVLTTFPIEFQKFFKNLKVREDNYQNLKIIRVARPIFHWNNCFTHWISDLIFSFLSYKNSVNIPDVDLMIVIAPPYYYLGNAFKIARRRRTPLVVDLNELSLETNIRSLSQFNFKNWFLQRQLNKIFEKVFAFITPTKALKNYLVFKFGISLNKVFYLPNGADIKFFTEKVDSSFIIRQYNLYDDFIVSYTGILSEDQNPCILIETALLLKENKQIKFLIVGGGPLEEKLKIKAKELKLNNIIFIGLVPHSEINKYINLSDVCLVLLKNDFKLKDSVPSKIFEYMAARKPIIINLEGEGSKIIEEAQCGLIIKPDNPNDLKEAILKLYNDRFLREKLGLNGYNYVNYNFNKEDLANQLEKILHAFIK